MEPLNPHQTITTTTDDIIVINSGPRGENGCLTDQTTIVKGKRTKRQRSTNIVTHLSTSYNAFTSSPSSSNSPATSTTTEDEDTANCLILLSKGHNMIISSSKNINDASSIHKFISKKYIQASTDDHDGISGTYVYECKTCSRTFPSFQALGGHRASHMKPRNKEIETKKPRYTTTLSDEDEHQEPQFLSRKKNSSPSSSISLQLNYPISSTINTKKTGSKIHECSICGVEFNSGQALGGHMRRHRATPTTSTTINTILSLVPYNSVTTMVVDDQENIKSRNEGLFFELDLNLPAPTETIVAITNHDHLLELSQQVAHLSATPTLVDCHN